jgi:hypothetical protein
MAVNDGIRMNLNDSQGIEITLLERGGSSPPHYLSKVSITFYSDGLRYDLGVDVLDTILIDFESAFKEVLTHGRGIHPLFEGLDIGYYYNIYEYNLWQSDESCEIQFSNVEDDLSKKSIQFLKVENMLYGCLMTKSQGLPLS